ncbi:MAG: ribonuclease H-like domain-containing protein, partial [Thermodesulfovibrionales bacterium]|nr:ribonuclease H-like domain-containing protein [Thermodesulfovibrionales bacterium]
MRKILIALFILAFVSTAPSIGNGEQRGAFTDLTTNMEFVFVKGGYVTVVGMYDGCDYKCFVRGNGLSPENLNKELSGYKYLITFYGAAFDIPFLFRSMPGLRFDIPHFDICFGSRKLGFQGGLKKLESSMGVERDEAVKGMDGYDA